MKMLYDKDLDYLEVFFEKAVNYSIEVGDGIVEFRAEGDDHVVGFGFDDSNKAFSFLALTSIQKLAILLFMTRTNRGLTQQIMADQLEVNIRQYQRFESGEDNTTLEKLDEVKSRLPGTDFSVILKSS